MSKKNLYVSVYGTWGTEEVQMFDTTNWLDKDWDKLDAEGDFDKLPFAKYITRKRNKQAKRARDMIAQMSQVEIRTFIIDEDGVEEV
jgi:SRSO17 transposase